jgi:Ni,Fe-hydrogenase III large subunit/Ni,Fe-hydrogenase III component G
MTQPDIRMDVLRARLVGFKAHAFVVRQNTLHFQIPRSEAPGVFRLLMNEFGFDLSLMAANDRCANLGVFQVFYLFSQALENWFAQLLIEVPERDPHFVSLATSCYPASRYEREIHDLFGLIPDGHPDLRPLVRHGFWPEGFYPLRKNSVPPPDFKDDGRPFPFRQVEGEGVYEIPVGPVHAGVIEPGHFRFSVDGETIIDMKSRLYFTHKGTEKLFEGQHVEGAVDLAERISGDTSVGHSLAFCQAVESLAGIEVPVRARYWRVILLELERLYNHAGDFGAIANDTGFALAHAHALRIRERLLRLNRRLTGHRLLRGILQPGGLKRDLASEVDITVELESLLRDFESVVELCWNNSMFRDRLAGTGRLTERTARDHGVLGYVARASGIDRDVRRDHPFAAYAALKFDIATRVSGDVEARTLIRVEEFRTAIDLIRQAFMGMPGGDVVTTPGSLPAWQPASGMVEGWRGAIVHWLVADTAGLLFRVKVQDPSFVNWPALSFALLKNIVPDFPLCNKSFNQSYSGNDL